MASPPIPGIVLAAAYLQAVPAAALLVRRNRSHPVVLIAVSFLLNLVADEIGRYVGHRTGNSLWVNSLAELVVGPIVLLAIAEWQISYIERLMLRISVAPFLLIYGGLTLFVEDVANLPTYSAPFLSLMVLGASTWTLLRRALRDTETPLLVTDWFLILGGLALHAATTAASTPIGAILIAQRRFDLMARVWEWRSVGIILALLAVTLGVLTPPAREPAAP